MFLIGKNVTIFTKQNIFYKSVCIELLHNLLNIDILSTVFSCEGKLL